jgi:uncharacterized damage-inducible protein DinB
MEKEIAVFLGYLDGQREHVLDSVEGLDEEQLRRPVLPTGWSCLGLIRHLAYDVKRFWFAGVQAGEPEVTASFTAGAETHWALPAELDDARVLAAYRAEIERANAVIEAASGPEEPPKAWPEAIWPDWRLPDLRHILLHVITEVACHAGHLDAARELVDGGTWMAGSPYVN